MGLEHKDAREKSDDRRQILIGLGVGAAGATAIFLGIDRLLESKQSPNPGISPTQEKNPTPSETAKATEINTLTPSPTATETEIPKTSTPDYSEFDKTNWDLIQSAESESTITFENPAITHIIKLPRPGPDAYFGLIKVQRQDNKFEYILAENFDCEHQELLKRGLLKEPVDIPLIPVGSGVWPVEGRPLAKLDAKVFLEYAAGTIPWVISDSFIIKGETVTISCPKTFSLPREIGETIVQTTKPIIERIINYIEEKID